MNTKRDFVEFVYRLCKERYDDGGFHEIRDVGNRTVNFYMDDKNDTIMVGHYGYFRDMLNEMTDDDAFYYASAINEYIFGLK